MKTFQTGTEPKLKRIFNKIILTNRAQLRKGECKKNNILISKSWTGDINYLNNGIYQFNDYIDKCKLPCSYISVVSVEKTRVFKTTIKSFTQKQWNKKTDYATVSFIHIRRWKIFARANH